MYRKRFSTAGRCANINARDNRTGCWLNRRCPPSFAACQSFPTSDSTVKNHPDSSCRATSTPTLPTRCVVLAPATVEAFTTICSRPDSRPLGRSPFHFGRAALQNQIILTGLLLASATAALPLPTSLSDRSSRQRPTAGRNTWSTSALETPTPSVVLQSNTPAPRRISITLASTPWSFKYLNLQPK